tara:strand:+ start:528 stop:1157 length:630 start_codon:yes stop_codon:yes gene_type:complete
MRADPPIQSVITLDVEGVLTPEIWIALANHFGIEELTRTTKDEPDYQLLMETRIQIVNDNKLLLHDIQKVIATLTPLEGAKDFLDELRAQFPVILLSDTFEDFIGPLMHQLGNPLILCHKLSLDSSGAIIGFTQRTPDQKFESVRMFQGLNYKVIAAGDSYNDLSMIDQADAGFLFRAPDNVQSERNDLEAYDGYDDLLDAIRLAASGF